MTNSKLSFSLPHDVRIKIIKLIKLKQKTGDQKNLKIKTSQVRRIFLGIVFWF